jgi:hypothetical protein
MEKQMILKDLSSTITLSGGRKISGSVSLSEYAALVKECPELKDSFEEVVEKSTTAKKEK